METEVLNKNTMKEVTLKNKMERKIRGQKNGW